MSAYTREVPVLREEYGTLDLYELVHFLPSSLWNEIKGQISGAEEDLALAYYLSWKKVRQVSLTDALHDDTLL